MRKFVLLLTAWPFEVGLYFMFEIHIRLWGQTIERYSLKVMCFDLSLTKNRFVMALLIVNLTNLELPGSEELGI